MTSMFKSNAEVADGRHPE